MMPGMADILEEIDELDHGRSSAISLHCYMSDRGAHFLQVIHTMESLVACALAFPIEKRII